MSIIVDFFDQLKEFIPTFQTVNDMEGGIFLRCGRHKSKFFSLKKRNRVMKSLNSGMYLCWPFIDEIMTLPRNDQVVDLRSQSLITSDGVDVIVSGAIGYRVRTPHLAILNAHDVDAALSRIALGVIAQFVKRKTFEECREIDCLLEEIQIGIKESAGNWGLTIWAVMITDIGNAINLRLLGNEHLVD